MFHKKGKMTHLACRHLGAVCSPRVRPKLSHLDPALEIMFKSQLRVSYLVVEHVVRGGASLGGLQWNMRRPVLVLSGAALDLNNFCCEVHQIKVFTHGGYIPGEDDLAQSKGKLWTVTLEKGMMINRLMVKMDFLSFSKYLDSPEVFSEDLQLFAHHRGSHCAGGPQSPSTMRLIFSK